MITAALRATVASLLLGAALPALASAQAPPFRTSVFSDTNRAVLAGTAVAPERGVLLTRSASGDQAGAAWHPTRVRIDTTFTFRVQFRIWAPGGQSDWTGRNGADGIALVIQDDTVPVVGPGGGQMGYSGIWKSLAVEFDTYANSEMGIYDPNAGHISVQTRGFSFPNYASHTFSIACDTTLGEIADGLPHVAILRYTPGTLRVFFDGCDTPRVTVYVDIASRLLLLDGMAWVGVTSGSQSSFENHLVESWCFSYDTLGCACQVECDPDTVIIRDTLRRVDTLTLRDTLIHVVHDTLTRVDTLVRTVHDTLTLVLRDTLTLRDTIVVHDTLTRVDTVRITVWDTIVVHDTLRVPCDPRAPVDSICGGRYRAMDLLEYWMRIVSVAPNPASSDATITYEVDAGGRHQLLLYNTDGTLARTLYDGSPAAGQRLEARLDVARLAAGRYILVLTGPRGSRWTWVDITK